MKELKSDFTKPGDLWKFNFDASGVPSYLKIQKFNEEILVVLEIMAGKPTMVKCLDTIGNVTIISMGQLLGEFVRVTI